MTIQRYIRGLAASAVLFLSLSFAAGARDGALLHAQDTVADSPGKKLLGEFKAAQPDGDLLREPPAGQPGEDWLGEFTARVAESLVSFDYSFITKGAGVDFTGRGTILLQGESYYIEGNGLRIWCDGISVRTLDEIAGEAVIEPADAANGLAENPVLVLKDLVGLYTWDKAGSPATFAGVPCRVFTLSPVAEVQFKDVRVYLSGENLVGAALRAGGLDMTFTVSSFEFRPCGPAGIFIPAPFPEDVIVTDLR